MQSFPLKIEVNVAAQRLDLLEIPPGEEPRPLASFTISTSGYGTGSEEGSLKTPLGHFEIADKIGGGAPVGTVFKGRLPNGEIAPRRDLGNPEDLILTRILRLRGLEEGNANTYERYIYIHGTNHEETLGTPTSHGCIRMANEEIARFFEMVEPGTPLTIV